jgi:hypothetical protein
MSTSRTAHGYNVVLYIVVLTRQELAASSGPLEMAL